jgi:type II secretory pathway component GspD/PulD (secretin)
MVTEVNRDDLTRLGIDWFSLGAGVPVTIGEPVPVDAAAGNARPLPIGKIMRTPLQWGVTLHGLEEKGRARILSNPSVSVLDGRQTALHTGDTILYSRITSFQNGYPIYTTEELQVGINLTVNPRVSPDGVITLTLSPSVSAVTGYVNGLPTVTERTVVTTVQVKNGETAVIAGLVSDEQRSQVTKVPFLGSIPVLGELFKFRSKSPSHTEVLIFVTPTLVGS